MAAFTEQTSMMQITMTKPGEWTIDEHAPCPPAPGKGQVLVRTGAIGVCGTDYHAFKGQQNFFTYPRIVGHELGVTVVAVGEGVDNVQPGDRCSVEPYYNCGDCVACRRGRGNCCTNISVIGVHEDGGMRDLFIAPAHKLHRSETLSLEQLALVETLCIGAHAVARAAVEDGENVLVIGAGPVGMGTAQFAKAAGGNVVVMDVVEERLAFIREQVGIEHTLNARGEGDAAPAVALPKVCGGDMPTCVIDATGNIHSMKAAFNFVAHGGRLVYVGHTKNQISFDNPLFHSHEMTVMGSRNALGADFDRVIALIEAGKVDVTPWITHRCELKDFVARFAEWKEFPKGLIKAIVSMPEGK